LYFRRRGAARGRLRDCAARFGEGSVASDDRSARVSGASTAARICAAVFGCSLRALRLVRISARSEAGSIGESPAVGWRTIILRTSPRKVSAWGVSAAALCLARSHARRSRTIGSRSLMAAEDVADLLQGGDVGDDLGDDRAGGRGLHAVGDAVRCAQHEDPLSSLKRLVPLAAPGHLFSECCPGVAPGLSF
jgi:hypothetical protein